MLEVHVHETIHELRLARPPANALHPPLLREVTAAIDTAIAAGARGLVLSGAPGVFTAGLDFRELLGLDRAGMIGFMNDFHVLIHRIARCPVPIAAAITGHSPAAGAVLAVFCDWRVMAQGNYRIGLNEVQVGLFPGPMIYGVLERLVGTRHAGNLLVAGAMLEPDTALAVGFVDELAPLDQVTARAVAHVKSLAALPPIAMSATRAMVRADLIALLETPEARNVEALSDRWLSEETQATIKTIAARVKRQS